MGGSMTKVLPGLYLGDSENARDEQELFTKGITHLLMVESSRAELEKPLGLQPHHISVNDEDPRGLLKKITEANEFIHKTRIESGNVLVYSDSGVSANVAVVAAYLMTVYGLDSSSSVAALQGLRNTSHPVAILQEQLDQFGRISNTKSGSLSSFSTTTNDGNATARSSISENPTVISERERLCSIFGDWNRMDEDLFELQGALEKHKYLYESGVFLYEQPHLEESAGCGDALPTCVDPIDAAIDQPLTGIESASLNPSSGQGSWTTRSDPRSLASSFCPSHINHCSGSVRRESTDKDFGCSQLKVRPVNNFDDSFDEDDLFDPLPCTRPVRSATHGVSGVVDDPEFSHRAHSHSNPMDAIKFTEADVIPLESDNEPDVFEGEDDCAGAIPVPYSSNRSNLHRRSDPRATSCRTHVPRNVTGRIFSTGAYSLAHRPTNMVAGVPFKLVEDVKPRLDSNIPSARFSTTAPADKCALLYGYAPYS